MKKTKRIWIMKRTVRILALVLLLVMVRPTATLIFMAMVFMLVMLVITAAAIVMLYMLMLMVMIAASSMAMLRNMPHAGMVVVLATVATGAALGMIAIILGALNMAVHMSKAAHFARRIAYIF